MAILGAADFHKLIGRTLEALLDKKYSGEIYPVNPKCAPNAGCAVIPTSVSFDGIHLAKIIAALKHE